MRVFVVLGVCVLLFGVNIEAAKKKQNKNQAEFFDIWETENSEGGRPDDFNNDKEFIIDDEGSGFGDDDMDVTVNTHEDDEDFPSSGDGEPEEIVKGNKGGNSGKQPTDDEDDDDLYEESGSGMGEEMPVAVEDKIIKETTSNTEMTPKPDKPKKLSRCEQWRSSAKDVGDFVPMCDEEGEFAKMQCRPVDPKTKEQSCWCVTQWDGTQVPGTLMVSPNKPDCLFGNNLKGCVFQLVQNGQNLLGAERPRCDLNGEWEPVQCHGSKCWCVDQNGNQVLGSFTDLPQMPDCDKKPAVKPIKPGKPTNAPTPKNTGGYTVDTNIHNHVVVTVGTGYGDQNDNLEGSEGNIAPVEHQRDSILGQPGFLAAIIAGGVITLLLIVLLVMFIVYRMRKKDEGSYPLDEQKYQNYSYAKAPDKEFYA